MKIKNCPFCDSSASVLKGGDHHMGYAQVGNTYWVECDNDDLCGASGGTSGVVTDAKEGKKLAIEKWNSRAK